LERSDGAEVVLDGLLDRQPKAVPRLELVVAPREVGELEARYRVRIPSRVGVPISAIREPARSGDAAERGTDGEEVLLGRWCAVRARAGLGFLASTLAHAVPVCSGAIELGFGRACAGTAGTRMSNERASIVRCIGVSLLGSGLLDRKYGQR
jgi:hypothetical protein